MKTVKAVHKKPKKFQIGWSHECFVYGMDKLTICNFSGQCKECPKFNEARRLKTKP